MERSKVGRDYRDGEIIIHEGESTDRLFIIQTGKVRVTRVLAGKEIRVEELGEGDLFGEMAVVDREVQAATVSAIGRVRLLSMDRENFLRRVHEDPSLAYPVFRRMSQKIHELSAELSQLRAQV